MLINFCDSSFAIGESQRDQGVRYLKQIKARNAAIQYHADNVLLGTIEKKNSLLQFTFAGTATEREHLKPPSDRDKAAMVEKAKEMAAEGKTTREIAEALGISKTSVSRYVNHE
jgi:DNA-binding NarL/FixJ family response regulator